jgi:hypothetical protein
MISVFFDKRLLKKKLIHFFNRFLFTKQFHKNKLKLGKKNIILDNVNKYGIFKGENFINNNLINDLSTEFEKIVSVKNINERNQIQLTPEEAEQNKTLNNFIIENEFFDLLGQNYLLSKKLDRSFGGKRIFPMEPKEFANYQWHHDGDYKCFKIFILLSDIDEEGQKMEYLMGTHKLLNSSYNKILKSNDPIVKKYKKVSLIGKKGTCYFFDGNGIHRGNRNNSYPRDILAITYRTLG